VGASESNSYPRNGLQDKARGVWVIENGDPVLVSCFVVACARRSVEREPDTECTQEYAR